VLILTFLSRLRAAGLPIYRNLQPCARKCLPAMLSWVAPVAESRRGTFSSGEQEAIKASLAQLANRGIKQQ